MVSFCDLPLDVILAIASLLDLKSLCSLQIVNRWTFSTLRDSHFWYQWFCNVITQRLHLFAVDDAKQKFTFAGSSYKQWKKLALFVWKNRALFGMWQCFTDDYQGKLMSVELCPQTHKVVLSQLGASKQPQLRFYIEPIVAPDCMVDVSCISTRAITFCIKDNEQPVTSCNSKLPQDVHALYTSEVLYSNKLLEISSSNTTDVLMRLVKLIDPRAAGGLHGKKSLLPPGIFTGQYGPHGREIIHVTEHKSLLIGSKLTGDPNVPFGKHSFVIDLNKPLILTKEEQANIERYDETLTKTQLDYGEQGTRFKGSSDRITQSYVYVFSQMDAANNPEEGNFLLNQQHCLTRYLGHGTVAFAPYFNPSWMVNELIVFDDNTFALSWPKLHHVILFKREHELESRIL